MGYETKNGKYDRAGENWSETFSPRYFRMNRRILTWKLLKQSTLAEALENILTDQFRGSLLLNYSELQ